METFSALLAIFEGIHRTPMNSPYEGQWRGALMFSLICAWINGLVNNREAGDLRRRSAHYDATVTLLAEDMHFFVPMGQYNSCKLPSDARGIVLI